MFHVSVDINVLIYQMQGRPESIFGQQTHLLIVIDLRNIFNGITESAQIMLTSLEDTYIQDKLTGTFLKVKLWQN